MQKKFTFFKFSLNYGFYFLLFLLGCSQGIEIHKNESNRPKISYGELNPVIDKAELVTWEMGFFGKAEITKGFFVGVKFRPINEAGVKELFEKWKVNSWLFKITKIKVNGKEEPLGFVYVPLVQEKKEGNETQDYNNQDYSSSSENKEKKFEFSSVDSFNFKVYFDAVAFRDTTENYQSCPPSNLRRTIRKVSTTRLLSANNQDIHYSEQGPLGANTQALDFLPTVLPGGNSLLGQYKISMALFDSQTNSTLSDFIDVGQTVLIDTEEDLILRKCY